jgi:hypothetical protein
MVAAVECAAVRARSRSSCCLSCPSVKVGIAINGIRKKMTGANSEFPSSYPGRQVWPHSYMLTRRPFPGNRHIKEPIQGSRCTEGTGAILFYDIAIFSFFDNFPYGLYRTGSFDQVHSKAWRGELSPPLIGAHFQPLRRDRNRLPEIAATKELRRPILVSRTRSRNLRPSIQAPRPPPSGSFSPPTAGILESSLETSQLGRQWLPESCCNG